MRGGPVTIAGDGHGAVAALLSRISFSIFKRQSAPGLQDLRQERHPWVVFPRVEFVASGGGWRM